MTKKPPGAHLITSEIWSLGHLIQSVPSEFLLTSIYHPSTQARSQTNTILDQLSLPTYHISIQTMQDKPLHPCSYPCLPDTFYFLPYAIRISNPPLPSFVLFCSFCLVLPSPYVAVQGYSIISSHLSYEIQYPCTPGWMVFLSLSDRHSLVLAKAVPPDAYCCTHNSWLAIASPSYRPNLAVARSISWILTLPKEFV